MQEIIGHDSQIRFLINSFKKKSFAHSYLFVGIRGVGKASVAKFFAKMLNCEKIECSPCNTCINCRKIDNFSHPDILWVEPQTKGLRSIKIEIIRELRERISLKPYEARFKVCIIKEIENLTEDAANSLLKTLEEPPANSILLLTTTSLELLLPTIVSRCQILKFHPLKRDLIKEELKERLHLKENEAETLAYLAQGSLGEAIEIWQNSLIQERDFIIDTFLGAKEVFIDDNEFINRERLAKALETLLSLFRDALMVKLDLPTLIVNIDQKDFLWERFQDFSIERLNLFIEKLTQYHYFLKHNANTRLILASLYIDLNNFIKKGVLNARSYTS